MTWQHLIDYVTCDLVYKGYNFQNYRAVRPNPHNYYFRETLNT